MNLAYFFEELKEITSYTLSDIRNQAKYTNILNWARHYAVGFMREFRNLEIEEAAAIVNVEREEAEEMFERHDKLYYEDMDYRKSYDLIINNLNFFSYKY